MFRRNIYYTLKPLIPVRLRRSVRGYFARRKLRHVQHRWPILEGAGERPQGWAGWPDGKRFAFVLTHDVEGAEGLAKVRQLAELEMSLGFRSSFNFVPEGEYSVPPDLRAWLTDNGFEVGVHDLHHDGKLYKSREEFTRRAKKINGYLKEWGAVGYRSGFMLHNYAWHHDIAMEYDATFFDTDPFEPQPDGAGTIFPFFVSRHEEREDQGSGIRNQESGMAPDSCTLTPVPPKAAGYVALPYTLPQDSTLFFLLNQETDQIWRTKLDWIAAQGGMAMLNTHPDYMDFGDRPTNSRTFPVRIYADFLRKLRTTHEASMWRALPRAAANHYRATMRPLTNKEGAFVSNAVTTTRKDWTGRRVAVFLFSHFPGDPRPRRAAEALAARGASVDFFCLRGAPEEKAVEQVGGIRVIRLPIRKQRESRVGYVWQYSVFFAQCLFRSLWAIRSGRYDLVHVHNMPDFLVFAALPAKLVGARVILDLHDPMPELMSSIYDLAPDHLFVRSLRLVERFSTRFADKVLTPNIAFRELFASRSCPAKKITIVMNSPEEVIFDPDRYATRDRSMQDAGEFRIMHHGFLVHRHGIDLLVEAVARLTPEIPGIHLDIFGGRTPFLDEVMNLAAQRGVADRVTYHGSRPLSGIAEAISRCDLGVIPNRLSTFTSTNFPTRIFEYIAMRCPVIAPRTKGICDYFDESQILMFEPGNLDDLTGRIRWAHQHRSELAEICRRGGMVYERNLWSKEREKLVSVAAQLLNGS